MVKLREAIEVVLSMYCRSCNSRNRAELSITLCCKTRRRVTSLPLYQNRTHYRFLFLKISLCSSLSIMPQNQQIPLSFTTKKNAILTSLSTPESAYTDLSPKGSVDVAIKPLIDRINALEGVVTTSSCAGRLSVFLEGRKSCKGCERSGDAKDDERFGKESEQAAVPGGKGLGGKWLFVSHESVVLSKKGENKKDLSQLLGLGSSEAQNQALALGGDVNEMRLVRFQFEPMVCRVVAVKKDNVLRTMI